MRSTRLKINETIGTKNLSHFVFLFSAGIGHTDTFIALDYLLEQAEVKEAVNIYKCVNLMRANRMNMVQNGVGKAHQRCHDHSYKELTLIQALYTKMVKCINHEWAFTSFTSF